jgi:hypothetical protein
MSQPPPQIIPNTVCTFPASNSQRDDTSRMWLGGCGTGTSWKSKIHQQDCKARTNLHLIKMISFASPLAGLGSRESAQFRNGSKLGNMDKPHVLTVTAERYVRPLRSDGAVLLRLRRLPAVPNPICPRQPSPPPVPPPASLHLPLSLLRLARWRLKWWSGGGGGGGGDHRREWPKTSVLGQSPDLAGS